MATELEIGDKAPDFDMPTDGGGKVTSSQLKGQKIVLYFYPKALTPGCTVESRDFTSKAKAFDKVGAVVIGVSKDPVKQLDKFKDKESLRLILASDETTKVAENYGVWGEKSMYGRTYMGIERATFLIDASGVIRGIWRKVKVGGHAEAVLEAARAL